MNAITIDHLCKAYPDFALTDLNLTLPSGCIMGLVGENGAGKSTTLRLLLGLLRRDSGSISLLGCPDGTIPKEDIGVVLDEVGVPHCLTAAQLGKLLAGAYRNWDAAAYTAYLKRLAVPEKKPFKDMSRGMKMKLGIAAALSHHPKLLILDEATNGLDPLARDEVLEILEDFTRDEGHSVLISSHIVSDLEKVCDYIAFLHKGRLMLCEEKDTLRERYGVLRCDDTLLKGISPAAVKGRRSSAYGHSLLVDRTLLPAGVETGSVDIEELFIYMAKEAE